MLYIVPTPIGNLGDITIRALEILKSVAVIACEDTRTSSKLLGHYGIDTPRISYHDHNEKERTRQLIQRLEQGEDVALISDAGMPLISDPGYRLLQAVIDQEIEYTVLPGASSAITALVGSGLAIDKFHFDGFLPQKKGRQTRIRAMAERRETTVAFESPHRIVKTLHKLSEYAGDDRRVVVAREISKKFEEYLRGTIRDVLETLESRPRVKGEIVLVVEGQDQ
ncbi:MAG: 16S rRNA (cytidine(1402)-2'-O)-methyltransferase [Rhodothermales bacterium]|nr:16S rRNA (cytidine(1402)-2'-O)-methyltransferase [Rhodothermales bacterium]